MLAGLTISEVGDWLYGVALIVFIFEETGSAGWIAAATLFRLAPFVVLGPIAGLVAERFDRRRVLIVSDLVRAVTMFVLAWVAGMSGSPAVAIALVFASTVASTPYLPALGAMTPRLVPETELAAANALMMMISNVAMAAGPALGALFIALGSPATAFAINGVSFLVAAAVTVAVGTSTPGAPSVAAERESVTTRLRAGVTALTSSVGLLTATGFGAAASFIYGTQTVLLLLAADALLGIGEEGAGWLYASLGLGGLAVARTTSRLCDRENVVAVLAAGMLATGVPFAAVALLSHPAPAAVALAICGAGMIVIDVVSTTVIQRALPTNVVARVFGVLDAIAVGSILLGSVVAAPLADGLGLRKALVVSGVTLPALALVMVPALRDVTRRARERAEQLAPIVDRLARVGVFDGAARQSLEWMAGNVVEVTVEEGTAVVRQGEPAAHLFVVLSGSLDVFIEEAGSAKAIGAVEEGGFFGEIGLVERVPRTATVVAATPCRLWRISGVDFLAAVTDAGAARATSSTNVASCLARPAPADLQD